MLTFFAYLLRIIICSTVLYGYYLLLLRNKVFHQYNRFYLLAIVVLSLLLPAIKINFWQHTNQNKTGVIYVLQSISGSEDLDNIIITSKTHHLNIQDVYPYLYILVSAILLIIFLHSIAVIYLLLKKYPSQILNNIRFVNTNDAKGTPFSFLKTIFWNNKIDVATNTGQQIFTHELAHIQQKHSYDKLFVNIVLIFFWSNPIFWIIRKELNMLHEFIADKKAIENNDTAAFAAMILQATYPQHRFQLTNHFFYSPIKRRLFMLTKNNNPKVNYAARIMVLPLAALVFAAFSLKVQPKKLGEITNYQGKKIAVVIDAGHGGKDNGATGANGIFEKDIALSIAQKIKALNKNNNIEIVLTRDADVYIDVREKAAFAKKVNGDIFISIHCDAAAADSANYKNGASIFIAKNNDNGFLNESAKLGNQVLTSFKANYGITVMDNLNQRKVDIRVLTENSCPAILIETGYLTNLKDLNYLTNPQNQDLIATDILNAVNEYASAKQNTQINKTFNNNVAKNIDTKTNTNTKIDTPKNINKPVPLCIVNGEIKDSVFMKSFFESPENPNEKVYINVLSADIATKKYGSQAKNGAVEFVIKKNEKLEMKAPETIIQNNNTGRNFIVQSDDLLAKAQVLTYSKIETNPLILIDGVIKDKNAMNSLSPDAIESINVLKEEDKKAIEKYGNKAKNGVVEITTKNDYPNIVFTKVETEAKFPGGDSAWRQYLQKNLKADIPSSLDKWKEGMYTIILEFIVKTDGSLSDIKTTNYIGSKTAEHCINLVKNGPKWIPAVQNGKTVAAYKRQPITFLIQN